MGSRRQGFGLLASLVVFAGAAGACATQTSEEDGSSANAVIDRTTAPMSKARLDAILEAHPDVTTLDGVPALLPGDFRANVTLKHGRLREGERGHLVERDVSQSSDPLAPRVILWDERSGFTVSYNGGAPGQTAGQRLDLHSFDTTTKRFSLTGLDFTEGERPTYAASDCKNCHGPRERPVFSMYPDWPSFYGSDNDELTDGTKEVQTLELRDYRAFRRHVAETNAPRYAPLFEPAHVRANFRGIEPYETFPFRQDIETNIQAVSRAFTFRPSLRLGILQNRLVAQSIAKEIQDHPRYGELGPLFLHDLLECRWSDATAFESTGWKARVASILGRTPRTVAGGRTLHYRDLLALFGLEVRDVDIRYSYAHRGYENDDATSKIMEIGYIDGEYWNSYFDGSATVDELLAMQLFEGLTAQETRADMRALLTSPNGLETKYARLSARYAFDKDFFQEMDRKGTWIPIPYPRARIHDQHHREGYPERFATQHAAICGALERELTSSRGGGEDVQEPTSCPSGCVASSYCKTHANASSAIKVNGLPCMVQGASGCQPCR